MGKRPDCNSFFTSMISSFQDIRSWTLGIRR